MDTLARKARSATTLASHLRRLYALGLLITSIGAMVFVAVALLLCFQANQAYRVLLTEAGIAQNQVMSLNYALITEVRLTRAYLLTPGESALADWQLAHENYQDQYMNLEEALKLLPKMPTLSLESLMAMYADYEALAKKAIVLRQAGQADAIELFDARSKPLELDILTTMQQLNAGIQSWLIQASVDRARYTTYVIILVVISFFFWIIVGNWSARRRLQAGLHALDHLERLVIETAQTGVVRPALQLQMAALKHDGLLYHASSLLMDHLAESHTRGVNFVEAISHQLRSPLASVLGFGAVLADPLTRPTDAEVERYAQIIVSQSGRMDQLIEKMLSAARIEAGQLDVTREPLHLRTLAVTVIEETKQQSRREIILKDDLGPAVCWGDALRLREVVLNLIENALKYSTLDTPVHVILQRAEAGNWAEITVTDQGIGIAQNELPGLFTRFGRIRNEQTRGIPGNGLGLYIVKYIVERHNGSILVHSQPGQGTKFTVRLPLE